MSKFFKANKSFEDYIKAIGFQHVNVDSDNKYFTNDKGNQIKIDSETGIISLLNNKGYVVDYSSTYSNKQIDNFAKGDN